MKLADADVIAGTDIAIALMPAPDFVSVNVNVLFGAVVSTSIDALTGAIMAWFMNGIGVDVLVEMTSNCFIAVVTAWEFSVPTP